MEICRRIKSVNMCIDVFQWCFFSLIFSLFLVLLFLKLMLETVYGTAIKTTCQFALVEEESLKKPSWIIFLFLLAIKVIKKAKVKREKRRENNTFEKKNSLPRSFKIQRLKKFFFVHAADSFKRLNTLKRCWFKFFVQQFFFCSALASCLRIVKIFWLLSEDCRHWCW